MKKVVMVILLSALGFSTSVKADIICGVECVNDAQFGYNLDLFICSFASFPDDNYCREGADERYNRRLNQCIANCGF